MTLDLDRLAAGRPGRPAVVDDSDGETVSYRELADLAADLAGSLASRGVEPGDVVVTTSRLRVEPFALAFAARRLGATLVPLSHRLPTNAFEALCDRLDAVVAYERAARDLVRGVREKYTFEKLTGEPPGDVPASRPDADAPLLAFYGGDDRAERGPEVEPPREDTGRVAGRVAGFSAAAVERNCAAVAAGWGLGRHDVSVPFRPPFAPETMLQAVLPVLYAGGTVVLHRAFDPPDARRVADEYGATFLVGGPKELDRFAEGLTDADGLPTVEWAAYARTPAVEAPAAETVDALETRGASLVRTYGRLLTGPNACHTPPGGADADHFVPFPDAELRLADVGDGGGEEDAEESDAAEGGAGQSDAGGADRGVLEVGGPLVATRHLDPPADAWVDVDEWVRTGDRARRVDDGYVFD